MVTVGVVEGAGGLGRLTLAKPSSAPSVKDQRGSFLGPLGTMMADVLAIRGSIRGDGLGFGVRSSSTDASMPIRESYEDGDGSRDETLSGRETFEELDRRRRCELWMGTSRIRGTGCWAEPGIEEGERPVRSMAYKALVRRGLG